jgi:hypothetical protein
LNREQKRRKAHLMRSGGLLVWMNVSRNRVILLVRGLVYGWRWCWCWLKVKRFPVVCVRTPITADVRRRSQQQLSRRAIEVEHNCSATAEQLSWCVRTPIKRNGSRRRGQLLANNRSSENCMCALGLKQFTFL